VLSTRPNRKSYMGCQLVPKSVTFNDLDRVMAVTLRYFTEFGKPAFQHITASARKKERSSSLSHLLRSFLYNFLSRNAWVLCADAIILSTALKFLSPEAVFFSSKYIKCHLTVNVRLDLWESYEI